MPFISRHLALSALAASSASAAALARRQFVGDTSGCGITHDFAGQSQMQYNFHGGSRDDRSYLVHLPDNYDANTQYGLILAFHGHTVDASYAESDYGFSDKFNDNKIIVYPQGIDNAWGGPSYASVDAQEDLNFINDLLTHLRTRYCIDSSRVYATGHSNGGGFVGTLACDATAGANFAAFAPVSGAFYTDASGPDDGCSPARSVVPILEIHGERDTTIGYYATSGSGGPLPKIPDWLSSWAQRNGCDPMQEADIADGAVKNQTWSCQGQAAALTHYDVVNMEHVWASTEDVPDDGHFDPREQPVPLEGSQVILDFFNAHQRPA